MRNLKQALGSCGTEQLHRAILSALGADQADQTSVRAKERKKAKSAKIADVAKTNPRVEPISIDYLREAR